jgi:hypothetical protein
MVVNHRIKRGAVINGCAMQKTLKVPFSELTVIGVSCRACKTHVELQLDRLGNAPLLCPACRNQVWSANFDEALRRFAESLTYLQKAAGNDFQFVLPVVE